jgi:hypothetical protein
MFAGVLDPLRDWSIWQFDLRSRFGAFFPGERHAHCFDLPPRTRPKNLQAACQV